MHEQRIAETEMRALGEQQVERLLAERWRAPVHSSAARPGSRTDGAHLVHHLGAAHALATATWRSPASAMRAAAQGEQHQDLVVADDAVDPVDAVRLRSARPRAAARPACRGRDRSCRRDRPAGAGRCSRRRVSRGGVEQALQVIGAAMNVADREHGLAVQRERRGHPGGDFDGDRHCPTWLALVGGARLLALWRCGAGILPSPSG